MSAQQNEVNTRNSCRLSNVYAIQE